MSTETKGPLAALNLPARTSDLIVFAKKVSVAMDNNPHFPSPDPPLAQLDAATMALDDAETAIGGGVDKTKKRNAARLVLARVLIRMRHYVHGIADQQSSPADAAEVIASAGMFVKKVGKYQKPALSARPGPVSGSVRLVAQAAAPNAAYTWQLRTAEQDWTSAPQTMTASTLITGLPPAVLYTFRMQALTRAGLMEWSQSVSLLVP